MKCCEKCKHSKIEFVAYCDNHKRFIDLDKKVCEDYENSN